MRHFLPIYLLTGFLTPTALHSQLNPVGAQVNLYFPQLADGGPASQQWQTGFIFSNPSTTTASVRIYLYANDGSPLSLDFGSGQTSTISLTVPPTGTRTIRSLGKGSTIVTGWAFAASNTAVQATVLFGFLQNGVHALELSAPATLPSPLYRSFATRFSVSPLRTYTITSLFQS